MALCAIAWPHAVTATRVLDSQKAEVLLVAGIVDSRSEWTDRAAPRGEIAVDARILRTARKGTSAGNPLIVPRVPIHDCGVVLTTARYRACTPWLCGPHPCGGS
jgi:hypothetical protein